jgi:hypothetical protein
LIFFKLLSAFDGYSLQGFILDGQLLLQLGHFRLRRFLEGLYGFIIAMMIFSKLLPQIVIFALQNLQIFDRVAEFLGFVNGTCAEMPKDSRLLFKKKLCYQREKAEKNTYFCHS